MGWVEVDFMESIPPMSLGDGVGSDSSNIR
mgnify:FL=1